MKSLIRRVKDYQGPAHVLPLIPFGIVYAWKWGGSVLPEMMWISRNNKSRVGRAQFHNGMGFVFMILSSGVRVCTKDRFEHWSKDRFIQFFWKGKRVWGF